MKSRIKIYSNLINSALLNEIYGLGLFHAFTNATEYIKIKNRGFSFIHINKNGGSSVERVLGIKDQSHLPYYALEDYYGVNGANKLKLVTIVRNPYDRVVSQYFYRWQNDQNSIRTNGISFKEFCRMAYLEKSSEIINYPLMFATQYEWLQDHNSEIQHLDYIGKFEDFQKSISNMMEVLQLKNINIDIPQKRTSKREKDWRNYYDQDTKEIVFNYFKKDFEAFGYDK
jgi:hypothetical protein